MKENLITVQAEGQSVEIKVSAVKMTFNSFLSGLAWGLGSALGATIILALIIYLIGQLNTAPVIGHYVSNILSYIRK